MQVVWGDNVGKAGNYESRLEMSKLFVQTINNTAAQPRC